MIAVGEITQSIPTKRAYYVNFYDGIEKLCYLGNIGIDIPLKETDKVLCAHSDTKVNSGWVILCRIDTPRLPVPGEENLEKSVEQQLANEQEDLIKTAVGGYETDGVPDWGSGGDDSPVYGEIMAKSRTSEGFSKVMSDGSMINFVDHILHFILSKHNKAAIFRMKQLILDVIPGFFLNITPKDTTDVQPEAPTEASSPDKKKVILESGLAPDPEDNLIDFFMEAGILKQMDDPGYGKSADTQGKKIKRGGRLRIRDFAILESDIENKELRLTLQIPEADPTDLYQIRANASEFVISWGKQFFAMRDSGIVMKGDLLGFAGPWAMWSKTATETLMHNTELTEAQMEPICEWKEDAPAGGIKFLKSVYFGQNEEPAVLQSFIDNVYTKEMDLIRDHFHAYSPPAVVTGTSPALQAGFLVLDILLDPPLVSNILSGQITI